MIDRRWSNDEEEEYGRFMPNMTHYVETKKPKCWWKCLKWTLIVLTVLIVLSFIIIFIVLPLVVLGSVEVQTFLVFLNIDQPKDPEYENFGKYGVEGVRNLYITVTDYPSEKPINLGIWHLVPEDLIPYTKEPNFNYANSLLNSHRPVVIYFHGQAATRIQAQHTHKTLRKFFHVIAFDYRGYGDSTEAPLSETAVVNDCVQLYKWLMTQTHSDIYVWGHSLGSAISTHTVAQLGRKSIVPKGLVLEAPFTTLEDEMYSHPIAKIFSWLPWFRATIVEPILRIGLVFDNMKNILHVDCHIMIMNAEDDSIIPYTMGKELAQVATTKRDLSWQGNVTYHLFPGHFKYDHVFLTTDVNTPRYIEEFLNITRSSNNPTWSRS